MKGLLASIGFLTVIPVGHEASSESMTGRCAAWFPLVGLGIGGVLLLALDGLSLVTTPGLASWGVVVLWACVTGGLHLDGVADSFDGVLASATRERRREIMKDSRVGAFGAIGLVLLILGKVQCVEAVALLDRDVTWAIHPLLLAPVFGRWSAVLVAFWLGSGSGLGRAFAEGLTFRIVVLATILPVGLLMTAGGWALLSVSLCWVAAAFIGLGARVRIGWVSGDVLGLEIEALELLFLIVASASGGSP